MTLIQEAKKWYILFAELYKICKHQVSVKEIITPGLTTTPYFVVLLPEFSKDKNF